MSDQRQDRAELRQEIADVVRRELGDMVNRDYLIDALMPTVLAQVDRLTEALEASGEQLRLANIDALNNEAEVDRLRGVCNDWGSNYQSWVDATKAAEERAERAEADLAAATKFRDECERQYQTAIHAQGQAEADLADEKRRRAEALALIDAAKATVHTACECGWDDELPPPGHICDRRPLAWNLNPNKLRALLDTATEEGPGAP